VCGHGRPTPLCEGGVTKQQIRLRPATVRRHFYSGRICSSKRIGPHDQEIISILVGSLLGDGWAEKRNNSTRFHFHVSSKNVEYISWLHNFMYIRNYCSNKKPKYSRQIKTGNKVYFSVKFRTWSFKSLNWLYDIFYHTDSNGKITKVIPQASKLKILLTPQALAIWFMDDGSVSGSGIRISSNSFNFLEHEILQDIIYQNFGLTCNIQKHKKYRILYFPKNQLKLFSNVVKPYILPCMQYKIHS